MWQAMCNAPHVEHCRPSPANDSTCPVCPTQEIANGCSAALRDSERLFKLHPEADL